MATYADGSAYWPFDDPEEFREKLIDLGDDHWATLYVIEEGGAPAGFTIWHLRPDGSRCAGSVMFDLPQTGRFTGARWKLVSLRPLSVEPSILCRCPLREAETNAPVIDPATHQQAFCNDHGWVREGKWVRA